MKIKLIALDLDGTLLDERGVLTPETVRAVADARRAGVRVVVCTGRAFSQTRAILDELSPAREIIVNGGSAVLRVPDGQTLYRRAMPTGAACELCRELERLGTFTIAFFGGGVHTDEISIALPIVTRSRRNWRSYFGENTVVPDLAAHLSENGIAPDKIAAIAPPDPLRKAADMVRERFPRLTLVSSEAENIEITAEGVDKGSALRYLSEQRLGLSPAEVAAVGDSLNDYAMLEYAGFPVVMGNACAQLRALGAPVAPDNAHGGAAWAIHLILAQQNGK